MYIAGCGSMQITSGTLAVTIRCSHWNPTESLGPKDLPRRTARVIKAAGRSTPDDKSMYMLAGRMAYWHISANMIPHQGVLQVPKYGMGTQRSGKSMREA